MIIFCQEEAELEVNKKLLAKVFLLKDIWRTREPKVTNCYHYHQQCYNYVTIITISNLWGEKIVSFRDI